MTRQDQQADNGAVALQAGRDVVIQQAFSAEQMTQVMVTLAKELAILSADAEKTVDERLESFRKELLAKFLEPGRANPEAFRDPDFQYTLRDAQIGYVRSGDSAVRDTLVDLIARRSLEPARTRASIILGEAASKVPLLTINEFAALSLIYMVKYTIDRGIGTFPQLCTMIRNTLMPFVPDISREQSSIWHLQSLSCGSISMNSVELRSVLTTHYGGLIASGFDRARLEGHLPDGKKNYLDKFVESCAHDANKLQLSARSFEVLQAKVEADAIDLTTDQIRNVWNMFEATVPQDLGPLLEPHVPNVSALFELWKKTHLKHLDLSGLGIAIGHANAVRVFGLNVPLNIWIK